MEPTLLPQEAYHMPTEIKQKKPEIPLHNFTLFGMKFVVLKPSTPNRDLNALVEKAFKTLSVQLTDNPHK
jgi:hypothetical protein